MSKASLTHLNAKKDAHIIDVGDKQATKRKAVATGEVHMNARTLNAIMAGDAPKGDVMGTARIAGIQAAKRTADLIPLCHPLALTKITIDIVPHHNTPCIHVTATVHCVGPTGVEMEALTAVSVACLTLYDMAKALQKDMHIGPVRLVKKTGGKSDFGTT